MNKKEFIPQRPFDTIDAKQMQDWTEDAIKKLSSVVYNPGVVLGLKVTHINGLSLNVSSGKAYDNSHNFILLDSDKEILIQSGESNPRYDLVIARYKQTTTNNIDTANKYGYGTNYLYSKNILDGYEIAIIKGNASSSPVIPSIGANDVLLAKVYVPANATYLVPENITDMRTIAGSPLKTDNTIISETEPISGLFNGLIWYRPSTDETKVYIDGKFRDIGGAKITSATNVTVLGEASNTVNIGITSYNKDNDMLFVFEQGTYIHRDRDYTISSDGTKIVSTSGLWDKDIVFEFVLIKALKINTNLYDGTLLQDNSVTNAKLAKDIKIGSLTTLKTTNKSSVTEAINEHDDKIKSNIQNILTNKNNIENHESRIITVENTLDYELNSNIVKTNLIKGINTLDVDKSTPFNILNIKGRTLVNLLGRVGNCEDISKLVRYHGTIVTDTENKVVGSQGVKLTIDSGYTQATSGIIDVELKANKYYVLLVDVKNGNAANITIQSTGGSGATSINSISTPITDTTKFSTIGLRYNHTSDAKVSIEVSVTGIAGQYAYFDAFRIYEITYNEYISLNSMTSEQIISKYPYVDDVKPVKNPYVIKNGRNELPPFTEWKPDNPNNISISNPYTLNISGNGTIGTNVKVDVPIIPSKNYTISTGSSTTGVLYLSTKNENGNIIRENFYTLEPGTSYSFSILFNESVLEVNASSATNAIYVNPMLHIGGENLPFEPQNSDYVFYDTVLHSNVDGTVRDELFYRDRQPRKLKKNEEAVLEGSLSYSYGWDGAGYKVIKTNTGKSAPTSNQTNLTVVKYDGKILKSTFDTDSPTSDVCWFETGGVANVYITIADIDSGWGENYTPSEDEIKAYFNGWKMVNVSDGTSPYTGGTKGWTELTRWEVNPGGTRSTEITHVSTTEAARTWTHNGKTATHTPYRLIYQLAQPVEVPVTSEGAITLHEGTNVLKVGTGVVIREAVTPVYGGVGNYYINTLAAINNPLKYRTLKILDIYKRVNKDTTSWVIDEVDAYGKQRAKQAPDKYDPNASYSVTYFVLDRYAFTAPLIDLQGEYAKTVAGVLALESKNAADVETRVSVATMLLDKILRGEISMGTDWSKQIPKGFNYHNNNMLSGTTAEILNIQGKGYLTSIAMNPDTRYTVNFGVYIDGKSIVHENNTNALTSAVTSFTPLYRFNNSLVIKVRNNDTESRSISLRAAYTLDS